MRGRVTRRRAILALTLGLLLLMAAAPLVGELIWPVELMGYVAPVALLPLALLALAVGWPGRRRRGLAWIVAGLLVVDVAGRGLPPSPTTAAPVDTGMGLTVLTYNLGNGLTEPARLAAMLRESGADIVGLQEVTAATAAALATNLADRYPHQAVSGDGIPGKAVLSRYPIVTVTSLDLAPGRPDLRADIDVDGRPLTVSVAHPAPPRLHAGGIGITDATRRQREQLTALATTGTPVLLLGDLNLTDRHAAYHRLTAAGLTDAFAAAGTGPGFTMPARLGPAPLLPFMRIDYIWHTGHLTTRAAWVGPDAGSDHLPVLARLAWRAA
ncbi:MAG: endonuclease/exonuclease/phosphatase family protein [Chloroflexi bacterium]|nr:endonuclease/exonuclease/phosphatase family protein [Chloroflexota bacterium]